MSNGLDSKWKNPSPAQYNVMSKDFNKNVAKGESKKPNYSFARSPKWAKLNSISPGPGAYEHKDDTSSSYSKSKVPVINPT